MAETKLRIANSWITIGKKYVLDHKPNPTGANGMKDMTKFPFENNVTVEKVWFNEARRQFDTGFYNESPCLRVISDQGEKDALVKQYVKYIKTPYEKTFNEDLEPSEKNNFWENYKIEAWVNKTYDTTNINDLMELFHLLYNGAVCEKDEKNPILRQDAQFILTSTEKIKSKSKDKVKTQASAFLKFSTLANGDRDKLDLILQWLDRDDPSKLSNEDLGLIYYEIINGSKGLTFSEKFLEAEEEYETDKGKEKMEYFYAIRRLFNKRKIRKTQRGYVATESDIVLGNTLQDVAKFCLNDQSQAYSIVNDLISENPDVRRVVQNEHIKTKAK